MDWTRPPPRGPQARETDEGESLESGLRGGGSRRLAKQQCLEQQLVGGGRLHNSQLNMCAPRSECTMSSHLLSEKLSVLIKIIFITTAPCSLSSQQFKATR